MHRILVNARTRRWALSGGALAAGAALFAGGFLIADALDDDPSPTAGQPAATDLPLAQREPAPATGIPAHSGATDSPAVAPQRGGEGSSTDLAYGPCGVLGNVISGAAIDLAASGFEPSFLGQGFALRSLTVRADAPCNGSDDDRVVDPAVESLWRHAESGYEVSVSQRKADPVANVFNGASAAFSTGHYVYNVYVYSAAVKDPAARDMPAPYVEPANDPVAQALVRSVVAELAPDLGQQCFYTMVAGSWNDLAALGIGDPRGAIPSGYAEQAVNVRSFTSPAAGCDTPALEQGLGGLEAFFGDANGLGIYINASEVGPAFQPYAGNLDQYSASWSNGKHYFNIGAKTEKPLGVDVIRTIALALDPSFETACVMGPRELSESEVSGLGLRSPQPPVGFRVTRSSLTTTEPSGDCAGAQPAGQVSLNWTLEDGGATTIEASANRYLGEKRPAEPGGTGSIGPNFINWAGADGTYYSVSGYSKGISGEIARDILIAVARSLDPTLDPSTLTEGGGIPQPVPAGAPEDKVR